MPFYMLLHNTTLQSHIIALLLYIKVPTLQIPVPAMCNIVALLRVIVNISYIAVDALNVNVGDLFWGLFSSLL
jgi:hypothetical protein